MMTIIMCDAKIGTITWGCWHTWAIVVSGRFHLQGNITWICTRPCKGNCLIYRLLTATLGKIIIGSVDLDSATMLDMLWRDGTQISLYCHVPSKCTFCVLRVHINLSVYCTEMRFSPLSRSEFLPVGVALWMVSHWQLFSKYTNVHITGLFTVDSK